jgi:lysophospholipase L1-like esterase
VGRNEIRWAFYFEDFAATGGFTTDQIVATHLPTVLAAKPNACVVLGGINDMTIGAVAVPASTIANLKTIYTSLIAAGILPIACTIPPKNGYTEGPASLNAWISRYARNNGFPVLDFYSLLVDPSTSHVRVAV